MRGSRAAFLALLGVNLLVFAWAAWVDTPAPAAKQAVDELPRLVLATDPAAPSVAQLQTASVEQQPPEVVAPTCLAIGPFESQGDTIIAATTLRTRGFNSRQLSEEGEVTQAYLVYVTGLSTEADEARALQRLRANGVADASVLPAENGERRVSVGVFTERDRAERRLRAVRSLDFDAQLSYRRRPGTVYWLEVPVDPAAPVVPMEALVESGAQPLEMRPCRQEGAERPR
jgi:hypothetical protein